MKTGGPPGSTHTTDKFVKFQRLRWPLVDESSTVGLEILATVEKKLQQSIRDRDTWKLRPGGEKGPFAGMNVILTGDLWQFPPVKATAIFQNPLWKAEAFKLQPCRNCFGHITQKLRSYATLSRTDQRTTL